MHRVDLHGLGVVEARIFDQRDAVVGGPAFERIRPVVRTFAWQGRSAGMGEQLWQIGRGIFQPHHQRPRIGRFDVQRRGRQRSGADGAGVLENPQHGGGARGGLGVQQPPPAGHEILRRHGRAVGPLRLAQMEGPGDAVFGNIPALGDTRNRLAARVQRGQADHQVAQNVGFRIAAGDGGIERIRLRSVSAIEHRLRRCGQCQQKKGNKRGLHANCWILAAWSMLIQRER